MPAEVIQISDPNSGATAEVLVSQGFNCFSWLPALKDGPREMLWATEGFAAGDQRASSSGIPLLFPFPGRIGNAEFSFEGKTYQLPAGDSFGNAIHGFVIDRPWRLKAADGNAVEAQFQASTDAHETLELWPSDYRVTARYAVSGTQLSFEAEFVNTGDKRLPFGFGTHAYFRLPLVKGGDAEATIIRAPVDAQWDLENMIPKGVARAVDDSTPLAEGVSLEGKSFDTVYRATATDGPIVTEVTDPGAGRTVRQTTDNTFGCCVIYTPPHREAVCLEPYTCVPDPFRLEAEGQSPGLLVLEPGDSWRTQIVLEVIEA